MSLRERLTKRLETRRRARDEARKKKRLWTRRLKTRQERVDHTRTRIDQLPEDPLRVRALRRARVLVGVMEEGGNNRGAKVEEIIRYAQGAIGEPWCVDFVIYCYGKAGSKVVKPGFTRAVRFMLSPGVVQTIQPKQGDIVRFTFDHTGLFVKDNGNGTITTIEGNTGSSGAVSDGDGGDGVYRKIRSKSLVRDYLHVTG